MLRVQKQPNRWSCMPTAFSIVTGIPLPRIIAEVGHDGSAIIFPELSEPRCRRGFHPQELVSAILKLGYAATEIEAHPRLGRYGDTEGIDVYPDPEARMLEHLYNHSGVIGGIGRGSVPHAAAWDGNRVYDPTTCLSSILTDTFITVTNFWIVSRYSQDVL